MEDLYTKQGIDKMLEEDEMNAEEEGFMLGYLDAEE